LSRQFERNILLSPVLPGKTTRIRARQMAAPRRSTMMGSIALRARLATTDCRTRFLASFGSLSGQGRKTKPLTASMSATNNPHKETTNILNM